LADVALKQQLLDRGAIQLKNMCVHADASCVPSRLVHGAYLMDEGYFTLYVFMAVSASLLVLLCLRSRGSYQQLAAGVPVVGGNSKGAILANRKRFRQEAQRMLIEGYKEVR
jgi:hypothetical protein